MGVGQPVSVLDVFESQRLLPKALPEARQEIQSHWDISTYGYTQKLMEIKWMTPKITNPKKILVKNLPPSMATIAYIQQDNVRKSLVPAYLAKEM